MTKTEQESIKEIIEKIRAINNENIENVLSLYTPNNDDIYLSSEDFILNHRRLLNGFIRIVDSELGFFLPIKYSYHFKQTSYNGVNLLKTLWDYYNSIVDRVPNDLIKNLYILVQYQIVYGFWQHNNSEEDVNYIENRLSLLYSEYKKKFDKLEVTSNSLENVLQSIHRQNERSLKELDEVAKMATSARNDFNSISEIRDTFTRLFLDYEATIKTEDERSKNLNAAREKEQEQLDTLLKSLQKQINWFDEKAAGYSTIIDFAESKKQFINDKEQEIIKLTGYAADATLGHTFNKRMKELNSRLIFWQVAVPMVSILTIGWVVFLYATFSDLIKPLWLALLVNLFKSVPAFILLGFTIKQYNKERSLHEEYAFKAAIAMTINSYADRVQEKDKKDDLLMESTRRVYSKPKFFKDLNGKEDEIKLDKNILETVLKIIEKVKG